MLDLLFPPLFFFTYTCLIHQVVFQERLQQNTKYEQHTISFSKGDSFKHYLGAKWILSPQGHVQLRIIFCILSYNCYYSLQLNCSCPSYKCTMQTKPRTGLFMTCLQKLENERILHIYEQNSFQYHWTLHIPLFSSTQKWIVQFLTWLHLYWSYSQPLCSIWLSSPPRGEQGPVLQRILRNLCSLIGLRCHRPSEMFHVFVTETKTL